MPKISPSATIREAVAEGYYAKEVTLPLEGRHGHSADKL